MRSKSAWQSAFGEIEEGSERDEKNLISSFELKENIRLFLIFQRNNLTLQSKLLHMDLHTRKLQFIQEFLRLANDSIIEKFEKMLQQERKKIVERDISPMTLAQYEQRINNAIDDLKNNRVTTAKKLKKEIASWK